MEFPERFRKILVQCFTSLHIASHRFTSLPPFKRLFPLSLRAVAPLWFCGYSLQPAIPFASPCRMSERILERLGTCSTDGRAEPRSVSRPGTHGPSVEDGEVSRRGPARRPSEKTKAPPNDSQTRLMGLPYMPIRWGGFGGSVQAYIWQSHGVSGIGR